MRLRRWLALGVALTLYLPILLSNNGPVAQTPYPPIADHAERAEFERLFLTHPEQGRQDPQPDLRLMWAAQNHADELCYREQVLREPQGYSLHIGLDGSTPNERVRDEGYPLPDFYAEQENQVESVSIDWEGPVPAWEELLRSETHRPHVLGEIAFFAEQVRYGIGVACHDWYVFVSAHPP